MKKAILLALLPFSVCAIAQIHCWDEVASKTYPMERVTSCVTKFRTANIGDVLNINDELIGAMPITHDLKEFSDEWSCSKRCRANEDLVIRVMPVNDGCVQVVRIAKGKRIPAQMYFDTSLCVRPSLDLRID